MTNKLNALLPMLALALFSCGKEESAEPDNGGKNKIEGVYDYVGSDIRTEVEQTVVFDAENTAKSVTVSHYITKNNTGTYTFSADKFVSDKVAYTVDTVMHNWQYWNGVLDSHSEVPFTVSIPPTGNTAAYRLAGTDSIYIDGGFVSTPNGGTAPVASSGCQYSWSGDTLIIKAELNKTTSTVEDGFPMTLKQVAHSISKLKKRS